MLIGLLLLTHMRVDFFKTIIGILLKRKQTKKFEIFNYKKKRKNIIIKIECVIFKVPA